MMGEGVVERRAAKAQFGQFGEVREGGEPRAVDGGAVERQSLQSGQRLEPSQSGVSVL